MFPTNTVDKVTLQKHFPESSGELLWRILYSSESATKMILPPSYKTLHLKRFWNMYLSPYSEHNIMKI